jgi:hypothetical protein
MEKTVCVVKHTCSKCGKVYEFPVFVDDLEKYTKRQEGIQYALPYISAEYRELMISGICPICWDEIMEADEEE